MSEQRRWRFHLGMKKFALRRCAIAKARNSSPCALKTPQIWRFCACSASFFAEEPLEGPCWASIFAPIGTVPVLEVARALQTSGGGGFAPCEALWRRVAGVSEAWMASFPPVGDGAAAPRGGVAAKVQTHWVKNGEKGPFWLNGSALWRIRCRAWCVVRTRTRYCEPKPAISHVNPLLRAWAGLPRLVLAG